MIQKVSCCQSQPSFGNAKSKAAAVVAKAVKHRNLKHKTFLRPDIYGKGNVERGLLNGEYRPYGGD